MKIIPLVLVAVGAMNAPLLANGAASGAPDSALERLRFAAERASGVTGVFEQLRLRALIAAALADSGDSPAGGRQLDETLAEARRRRDEVGPSFWMLLADVAEVQGRRRMCPEMQALYREVESLTAGPLPRDWQANRLYFEAECSAGPAQARKAEEALRAYGALLPAESNRGRRLRAIARP